jgi:alkylation response protein AidB-like acyl-CoA dehydrogenase
VSDTILLETAERLFGDTVTPQVLAAAERGEYPRAAWDALAEAGLHLGLLPESAGGFGVAPADALALLRVAGRHALPLPLADTMLAGWLLAGAGLPIPAGALTLAQGAAVAGNRVTGTARAVPWARDAAEIVIVHAAGDDLHVGLVLADGGAITITPGSNIAREPRDIVTFDAELRAYARAAVSPLQLRAAGAATRALLIAGALERITDMTTRYALDRVQFGRPIGRFQAIQHSLATLAAQTAAALAAGDIAAESVAGTVNIPAIAAAKARAGEAARIGAGLAHQIHGAIGFTYEHSLHFFTKRLHAWRDEYGGEAEWNERLGRHLVAAGADALWPTLTAI